MEKDFGLINSLFNVEMVMNSIDRKEPEPSLEITPIEGDIKDSFIIGGFRMTDKEYSNGDGQMQFSVSFTDKTEEENAILIEKHSSIIQHIALEIVKEAIPVDTQ